MTMARSTPGRGAVAPLTGVHRRSTSGSFSAVPVTHPRVSGLTERRLRAAESATANYAGVVRRWWILGWGALMAQAGAPQPVDSKGEQGRRLGSNGDFSVVAKLQQ